MVQKTHVEVNLGNLISNVKAIQKRVTPARVIPVVKADAYGHGAVPVTKKLSDEGYNMFAVAQFEEAMELRESGIDAPILIFGRLLPDEIPNAVKADFRISIFGEEDIQRIENCSLQHPARVHVKLETGMGRVGVIPENEPDFFHRLLHSQACNWEGLYSHFATSDEKDKTYANLQLKKFNRLLSKTKMLGTNPPMAHLANSGAVLDMPLSFFDAVRTGIILYGHYPSMETSKSIPLKQVMTFKTYVSHLRQLPSDHPISYGRRWTTRESTRIAVLPVGYADGIPRRFTNKGEVLIGGKRYSIVGTVTMDQTMVHVDRDGVQAGDEVVLWGDAPQGSIQALDLADRIGTIPYELTCGVSKRVKRVYVD